MPKRPRPPMPAPKLPLFDCEGWAARLVKSIRENGTPVAEAIGGAEAYAREVRDVECAFEAAGIVGQDVSRLRTQCPVPAAVIRLWQEKAAREFGPDQEFTDRKLARFLTAMYRDVRAAQMAEAVRAAGALAVAAEEAGDERKARDWRRVEERLLAQWQSVTAGGFVPVSPPEQ
jgi:hypothetical protein